MQITKKAKNYLYIIFPILIIISNILYVQFIGIRISPDSRYYSRSADSLIENQFQLSDHLAEADSKSIPSLRISFIYLIAILKRLLGSKWAEGLVAINLIISSLSILYFFYLIKEKFKHKMLFFLAFLLFILGQDFRSWIPFALTDILYSSGVFLIMVFLANNALTNEKKERTKKILLAIAITFVALIRPTTPLFLISLGLYLIWNELRKNGSIESQIFNRRFFLMLLTVALVAIVFISVLVFLQRSGKIDLKISMFQRISNYFDNGWVIKDRSELAVSPPESTIDILSLIFRRIYYFFVFWADAFSVRHTLLNLFFYVPVYGLAIAGIAEFFYAKHIKDFTVDNLVAIFLILIICTPILTCPQ